MNPETTTHPEIALRNVRLAVDVDIPSDVRYIERVVELVTRQCAALDYHPKHLSLNVPVALTEALSNAILRGNRERGDTRVQVRATVDQQRLVVEVSDEGEGFDLDECLADPTIPENILREDGRGLFLMSRLMDRVESFAGAGNTVRMILHRND